MSRVIRTISKMFVVLVMLFGNPPLVRLRDLARRPAVALVATARPPVGEGPPLPSRGAGSWAEPPTPELPAPLGPAPSGDSGRRYIPVKAA